MMDGVAYLIQKKYKKDSLNQAVLDEEAQLEIFVTVESVNRNEWFSAGRNGLAAEYVLSTAAVNYSGEKELIYNGTRYAIYRTYQGRNSDEIELYVQRKAGVQ